MVAPEVQGIDLFQIAGRSISGWVPSYKTSTSPNCTFSGELVPIDLKRFTDSGINLVQCASVVEECVLSPQARASSGSKHTPERRASRRL